MDKVYLVITLQSLRYNNHKENYKISLEEGVTPTGLKSRKDPAFLPATDGFQQKWDAILFNAERNLVELLLVETDSVIKKLELDFDKELKKTISQFDRRKQVSN